MRDTQQMSRNKFVQNWCVNSLCDKCEIILNNKVSFIRIYLYCNFMYQNENNESGSVKKKIIIVTQKVK